MIFSATLSPNIQTPPVAPPNSNVPVPPPLSLPSTTHPPLPFRTTPPSPLLITMLPSTPSARILLDQTLSHSLFFDTSTPPPTPSSFTLLIEPGTLLHFPRFGQPPRLYPSQSLTKTPPSPTTTVQSHFHLSPPNLTEKIVLSRLTPLLDFLH